MKRASGSPLPCFLPAGCMLAPPFFGFRSGFLLLRPWFIIPFTFPLDNHLSLCKHQSRTKELLKVRPVTHRRMFFSFSFMRLSSQENLFVMKLACLLFLRGSSFQLIVKIYSQLSTGVTTHLPLTGALGVPWQSFLISLCSFFGCCCFHPSFRLFPPNLHTSQSSLHIAHPNLPAHPVSFNR